MKKIKPSISKKSVIISALVTVVAVLIDYLSKIIVMKNMAYGESVPVIKNVLHLTYITNKGAAFGSFSDARWLFMTASVIMIAGLIAMLIFWDDRSTLFYVSVSMVLGGGIGNMIDRIFYGEVVDFIDFCAFPKLWSWIFNFADSFVCVGVGLLAFYLIRSEIKEIKKNSADADKIDCANSSDGTEKSDGADKNGGTE